MGPGHVHHRSRLEFPAEDRVPAQRTEVEVGIRELHWRRGPAAVRIDDHGRRRTRTGRRHLGDGPTIATVDTEVALSRRVELLEVVVVATGQEGLRKELE